MEQLRVSCVRRVFQAVGPGARESIGSLCGFIGCFRASTFQSWQVDGVTFGPDFDVWPRGDERLDGFRLDIGDDQRGVTNDVVGQDAWRGVF